MCNNCDNTSCSGCYEDSSCEALVNWFFNRAIWLRYTGNLRIFEMKHVMMALYARAYPQLGMNPIRNTFYGLPNDRPAHIEDEKTVASEPMYAGMVSQFMQKFSWKTICNNRVTSFTGCPSSYKDCTYPDMCLSLCICPITTVINVSRLLYEMPCYATSEGFSYYGTVVNQSTSGYVCACSDACNCAFCCYQEEQSCTAWTCRSCSVCGNCGTCFPMTVNLTMAPITTALQMAYDPCTTICGNEDTPTGLKWILGACAPVLIPLACIGTAAATLGCCSCVGCTGCAATTIAGLETMSSWEACFWLGKGSAYVFSPLMNAMGVNSAVTTGMGAIGLLRLPVAGLSALYGAGRDACAVTGFCTWGSCSACDYCYGGRKILYPTGASEPVTHHQTSAPTRTVGSNVIRRRPPLPALKAPVTQPADANATAAAAPNSAVALAGSTATAAAVDTKAAQVIEPPNGHTTHAVPATDVAIGVAPNSAAGGNTVTILVPPTDDGPETYREHAPLFAAMGMTPRGPRPPVSPKATRSDDTPKAAGGSTTPKAQPSARGGPGGSGAAAGKRYSLAPPSGSASNRQLTFAWPTLVNPNAAPTAASTTAASVPSSAAAVAAGSTSAGPPADGKAPAFTLNHSLLFRLPPVRRPRTGAHASMSTFTVPPEVLVATAAAVSTDAAAGPLSSGDQPLPRVAESPRAGGGNPRGPGDNKASPRSGVDSGSDLDTDRLASPRAGGAPSLGAVVFSPQHGNTGGVGNLVIQTHGTLFSASAAAGVELAPTITTTSAPIAMNGHAASANGNGSAIVPMLHFPPPPSAPATVVVENGNAAAGESNGKPASPAATR